MFRRLPVGFIPGHAPICLDSNDPQVVKCAFKQRLLRQLPVPDKTKLDRLSRFVDQWLKANVPTTQPLGFEEWLASCPNYTEERKKQLKVAYSELQGGSPTKDQCQHVDSFVKSEFYPSLKHARMINSRCDAFKVFSGPSFKAVEEVVYRITQPSGYPYFIKHVPVPDRPQMISSLNVAGNHIYSTDFTAFESHFTPEIMTAVECALYRHVLPPGPATDLIINTIRGKNKMRTRSGQRAVVKGRRMSGDMCTSLGNGFTNLMLYLFLCSEQGQSGQGFVEGDDGVFSTKAVLTPALYEQIGFTIKMAEIPDANSASFCGLLSDPHDHQIIRDPFKFLQGFGWTQSFIDAGDRIMYGLLKAKSLSAIYECPHCPIVGALSRYCLRVSQSYDAIFVEDYWHHAVSNGFNLPPFAPTIATRHLFESEYGIPVGVQLYVESLIDRGDFRQVAAVIPPSNDVGSYNDLFVASA